ncbi:MAG: phenylacetic acid degradation bifunctional protein PaaZ, partial [Saprospiraceae bacterium]|nr:phenylacetic acid degradation bifunctional protein PaaZ [Saprospiraceae bacterium]
MKLENFAYGDWIVGDGEGRSLHDAVTGKRIAAASSAGLDFEKMCSFAREKGGSALRKLTFHQRGLMLKALALHLHERRQTYYPISYKTGATKADSWIDIEGGIGNLFANASLRRKFPDQCFHVEGEAISLSKDGSFAGHHIMVPKEGVAIHINAFNFPIWGMLEKIAVNLLAGVPAIVKPASLTSFLTQAMVKDIVASDILPKGSLQLICGSAEGLLNHVSTQDVVTFTGSAETGKMLKVHPRIISESVPFNMEADSLNCIVLAEDAEPGTTEFELFIQEVRKEMTVKCGQKCTAIRRIFVPELMVDAVRSAMILALEKVVIGNPENKQVMMGALAGKVQVQEVMERVTMLSKHAEIVYGQSAHFDIVGADRERGAFMQPILLLQKEPIRYSEPHEIEAFGPVSTIMPYRDLEQVIELSKMGKGSLCCSIVTRDEPTAVRFVLGVATHHGRIMVLNRTNAKSSTGHGSPLPLLVHGGPGRAGGGEEMGGVRGVKHYLQRVAIQGTPTTLTQVTQVFQQGGKTEDPGKHLFRKSFDTLHVGESIETHKRTITESDIVQFGNVSWDHFYAHTDVTSLEGTTFERRVAHGYFVLAAAAGLFVDPAKGPVLLNYGCWYDID